MAARLVKKNELDGPHDVWIVCSNGRDKYYELSGQLIWDVPVVFPDCVEIAFKTHLPIPKWLSEMKYERACSTIIYKLI